ncbi:hypothetical protein [Occultella gossypii]|uniref:DUF1073 domain-containing protein n=1 Tax=Occultella gossypii TaxID=2800820 RepID=A0ABS7S703_9MICO|nr:hypothetical protein [Occultella gossypii]MBZ2195384.1 hypothetical protein [Occultella gossypii]
MEPRLVPAPPGRSGPSPARVPARRDAAPPTAALPRALIGLQRTAGNAAVVTLAATRNPASAAVQRQSRPPHAAAGGTSPGPGGTFARARTAAAYVALVREAESRLAAAGVSAIDDRIQVLSGIYYGTDWSLDYEVEASQTRNLAFQAYTTRAGPGADPRPVLGTSLYTAIKESQDVRHPALGTIDAGHLIIGLNARQSWTSRSVNVPTQGATGLEITTWVGDLGGATGQLARRRLRVPSTPASRYFSGRRGTDYGADSNLEGDVAAYVVGSAPAATGPGQMAVPPGGGIAETLEVYFTAAGASTDRATRFLEMLGGTFTGPTLTNRGAVEAAMAGKFRDFSRWYMGIRYGPDVVRQINTLLPAAAQDVAVEFVDWLLARIVGGRSASGGGSASGAAPEPDLIDKALDLARSWGL